MTRRRYLQVAAGVIVVGLVAWAVNRGLERPACSLSRPPSSRPPRPPAAGVPRITATLYYGSADGQALVPVRREVALAEGLVPQGREILGAQFEGAPEPLVSVIPEGTTLRALYVTDRGDAS